MAEMPDPTGAVGNIRVPAKLSRSCVVRPFLNRLVILGVFTAMTGAASAAVTSWAAPPQIPTQPEPVASCSYHLDKPSRTDLPSGVAAVTTTMAVTGCQGRSQPVLVTACIRADGLETQCQTGSAWIPAQLYFRPWRSGLVYTATGTGCALVGNPVSRVCTPMGPYSVGL